MLCWLLLYLKQSESSKQAFEFTHKSFGEYLTARRLVYGLTELEDILSNTHKRRRAGDSFEGALKEWVSLCGDTLIDFYLLKFIRREVALWESERVYQWQKMLIELIEYMLQHGMPMHELNIGAFREQERQARNAEEALLIILNSCARVTEKVSEITWQRPTDLAIWLFKLRSKRSTFGVPVVLFCLSWLDCKGQKLGGQDFYRANFEHSVLADSILTNACLREANLINTDLTRSTLFGADLSFARLNSAKLTDTVIVNTQMIGVDLSNADLRGTDLIGKISYREENGQDLFVYLQRADLRGAKLENTKMDKVSVSKFHLDEAKFDLIEGEPKIVELDAQESTFVKF